MNKRVVILSGLPGSYKSTYAKKLELEGAVVVSADHYFEVDGGYRFDRNLLGKAHGECLKRFIQFITEDKSVIIVDNTNLTLIDIAPYYAAARAFDYDVTVRTFFIDEEAATPLLEERGIGVYNIWNHDG